MTRKRNPKKNSNCKNRKQKTAIFFENFCKKNCEFRLKIEQESRFQELLKIILPGGSYTPTQIPEHVKRKSPAAANWKELLSMQPMPAPPALQAPVAWGSLCHWLGCAPPPWTHLEWTLQCSHPPPVSICATKLPRRPAPSPTKHEARSLRPRRPPQIKMQLQLYISWKCGAEFLWGVFSIFCKKSTFIYWLGPQSLTQNVNFWARVGNFLYALASFSHQNCSSENLLSFAIPA